MSAKRNSKVTPKKGTPKKTLETEPESAASTAKHTIQHEKEKEKEKEEKKNVGVEKYQDNRKGNDIGKGNETETQFTSARQESARAGLIKESGPMTRSRSRGDRKSVVFTPSTKLHDGGPNLNPITSASRRRGRRRSFASPKRGSKITGADAQPQQQQQSNDDITGIELSPPVAAATAANPPPHSDGRRQRWGPGEWELNLIKREYGSRPATEYSYLAGAVMRRARGSVVELENGGLGAARLEEQQEDVQKDGQKQGDEVSPYNSSDEDPLLQEYREAAASIYSASRGSRGMRLATLPRMSLRK